MKRFFVIFALCCMLVNMLPNAFLSAVPVRAEESEKRRDMRIPRRIRARQKRMRIPCQDRMTRRKKLWRC